MPDARYSWIAESEMSVKLTVLDLFPLPFGMVTSLNLKSMSFSFMSRSSEFRTLPSRSKTTMA